MQANSASTEIEGFDYIVVGSGAGGAPLAARLAQAGKRVLVIEAGPNHAALPSIDPAHEVTRVPSLHGVSTEHESLSWRYFVEHYRQLPDGVDPDPKRHQPDRAAGEDETDAGIFYPRASGIGGCTIHNAMITIAGPDSDWDDLADYLGDESWGAARMRPYFERLEANDYLPLPPSAPRSAAGRFWSYVRDCALWLFGRDPDRTRGRHGFGGWLHTSVTDISLGLSDKQLVKMLKAALWEAKLDGLDRAWTLVRTFLKGRIRYALDPNHRRTQAESPEGVVQIPLSVHGQRTTVHQRRDQPFVTRGHRSSPRELLLATLASHPDRLVIWTDCLVTKVLLDRGHPPRAVGVEFLRGPRLYHAHPNHSQESGEKGKVQVKPGGEVILCGGTFNTPQLLMLSGIGDPGQLEQSHLGIKCRVPLPGVGRNLQDRYEVSVVSELKNNFTLLEGATFRLPDDPQQPDPHLRELRDHGTGLYTSNGAVLGIFKRSRPDLQQPDLFIFGIPLPFRGYEVGYSRIGDRHNLFTWVILKSHTGNRDGRVTLRTNNPRHRPAINFHYFNETSRPGRSADDPDLLALVEGTRFVRRILKRFGRAVEVHPGFGAGSVERTKDWIRRDAWGHHACGTCRMGRGDDPDAVLDSRFRVRDVDGLRVVDASIFPFIPGYFIVTNLYMASEKAADVILEDANRRPGDSVLYPQALRAKEATALAIRRRQVTLPPEASAPNAKDHAVDAVDEGAKLRPEAGESRRLNPPVDENGDWNLDVTGLALSGGGIRSATFCLGILQSLARYRLLRRVDILSTVSGGGYIGCCLGRVYDRLRQVWGRPSSAAAGASPADRVEDEITSPDSLVVDWLRRHGNYIAPQGGGDGRWNLAVFVRNLLTVHFVIGLVLFALFGIANGVRYGLFDRVLAASGLVLSKGDLPIGHMVQSWLGPFFSPWFVLAELLVLFLVLPRMIGYWVVSQDRHESYQAIGLTLLMLIVGLLLWLGVSNARMPEPLFLGAALLTTFIHVEAAWARGRIREAAVGSGGVESQRLRTRNYLTTDLGTALALTGGAFAFALVDTLAHSLHEWKIASNTTYATTFAALATAIAAVMPVARLVVNYFAQQRSGPPSTLKRILRRGMMAGLLAVVLFTLPLVFYAFASHAAYQGGNSLVIGLTVTLVAVAFTLLLAHPKALLLVNRSSLAQVYAARLARAYLGASNPVRHCAEGRNVTEVIPGDDITSIRDYRPHEASGPLHLINVTVNQTVESASQARRRDRQGENLAVSCLGMTIGETWHSAWTDASRTATAGRTPPARLEPLGRPLGADHPLVDQLNGSADQAETLALRQWMAISGAAVDAGRGSTTSVGIALLMGLVNLRTGHWWDSGIAHAARWGFPRLSFLRRVLYLIPRVFTPQSLLLYEWLARYPGPWERFWHLADGGFFENTGGYELIRRRVPRIILCDGSADPSYRCDSFSDLVRKVRIDFAAHIEPFSQEQLDQFVDPGVRPLLGSFEELKPPRSIDGSTGGPSQRHAALFWVRYDDAPMRKSVLLYLKATLTGDEPADVQHYHSTHPEFPHEDTADQFFDEPQWESYRRLGEHLSSPICAAGDWLWRIPLT